MESVIVYTKERCTGMFHNHRLGTKRQQKCVNTVFVDFLLIFFFFCLTKVLCKFGGKQALLGSPLLKTRETSEENIFHHSHGLHSEPAGKCDVSAFLFRKTIGSLIRHSLKDVEFDYEVFIS